jgi:hypothetical protein
MDLPVGSWQARAGDRARLDSFRLRRGLEAADLPAYAAARLAALDSLARQGTTPPGPRWRPLGPFAIPHGRTAGSGPGSRPRVAGRVTAVAVDPRDPRHLLAGAGAGGVWESRDGGLGWRPRTDDLPSLAVGAVAFAPGDPAVAYAGTGQGEPLAALGVGLLRSGDGGATWRLLAAPELLGAGFHDLLVDPGDAGRLLAATTAGLWASGDRGATWERRLAGRSWAVSAGVGGELLAGGEHGLHRSEDGGATWWRVALPSAPGGFDRIAIAHGADGQVAYVFAAGDGVGHLWRREHAGAPFDPVRPPADLQSQQAWHSWACATDPGDHDVVWLGAFGLHRGARGRDGRWSWVDLAARPAGDCLPPAQHAVVFPPADPGTLYVANDGGLFRSPDGGRSWQSLSTGLAIAEIDRLTDHPDHPSWLLAAAGELGTLRYEGTEVWFRVGDTHPTGGSEIPPLHRAPSPPPRGPAPASSASAPIPPRAAPAAPGSAPDLRAAAPHASRPVPHPPGSAPGPPVGERNPPGPGVPGVVHSPPPGAPGGPLPEVPVSVVVSDPELPGTVYAATDAGVWCSRDGGDGWEPFGVGLPNAPALALAVHRTDRLLRVGLLGRGVWEVALAPGPDPSAAGPPSLRASRGGPDGWWWECPDIKVEPAPGPRAGAVAPVEFEDDRGAEAVGLPELGGRVRPGRPARVHVQVHQRGVEPVAGAWVRVLAVPACLRPPDLPDEWVAGGDPPPGSPWRVVGQPGFAGGLEPGRAGVASFDWDVPADLPGGVCLVALAAAGPGAGVDGVPADLDELAAGDGPCGLKSLTVVGPGGPRVVRLELWGAAGRGPFTLAAEGWAHGLTAGLVLGRRLREPAVAAGMAPGRVVDPWRRELVTLVQEDLGLAERLDLAAAYTTAGRPARPPGRPQPELEVWLEGIDLDPDRPEPLVLLLDRPPASGGGAVVLLDADGRVVGGHTLQAPG